MRVLIFGDSITQGMWDSQGGWAQRLIGDYFARQMKDLDADVPLLFNLGFSGDTTAHLAKRFPAEVEARRSLWSASSEFALVFAIGTNDSLVRGEEPFSSPGQYAADLEALITKATEYTSKDRLLFVGLQPCDEARTNPIFHNFHYTNARLQAFDQILQTVCAKHNVAYVPIFDTFRQHQQTSADLLLDGLHPDDKGHQLIYKQVKPALKALLDS